MLTLLLFLLLTAAASPCNAVLSGSFCSPAAINALVPNPNNPPLYSFLLSQLCLTFVPASNNFSLTLTGDVSYKAIQYAAQSVCSGYYYFTPPAELELGLTPPATAYCSQNITNLAFCWACPQFSGTFKAFFDNVSAPVTMTVGAEATIANPAFAWGQLPNPVPLRCNNTGCGSASGVVPNLNQGGNDSYTVGRGVNDTEAWLS
jgi:hypothetical protein